MIFQKISQNKLKRKRSRETAMEVKRPVLEDEGRTIFNFKFERGKIDFAWERQSGLFP
jgi:hypothetical protein